MIIPEDYDPMDFVLAVEKRLADKQKDLKQQVRESSDPSQDAVFDRERKAFAVEQLTKFFANIEVLSDEGNHIFPIADLSVRLKDDEEGEMKPFSEVLKEAIYALEG